MCQIDNAVGPINHHRRGKSHQSLRALLHPQCKLCDIEFKTRHEWNVHRFSEPHLIKLHKAGKTEVNVYLYNINYVFTVQKTQGR